MILKIIITVFLIKISENKLLLLILLSQIQIPTPNFQAKEHHIWGSFYRAIAALLYYSLCFGQSCFGWLKQVLFEFLDLKN